MRAAKVLASLRIRAVSPEPPLLAHTSSESRGTFRQKARSLAPLNDWACAVKICHDGMLEDANSLDAAQLIMQLALNSVSSQCPRGKSSIAWKPEFHPKIFNGKKLKSFTPFKNFGIDFRFLCNRRFTTCALRWDRVQFKKNIENMHLGCVYRITIITDPKYSHNVTKSTKWVCAQWRLRLAWASADPRLIWVLAGRTVTLMSHLL